MSAAYINEQSIYDVSLYTFAQASRYINLPSTTLRDWVRGRKYSTSDGDVEVSRLIEPAQEVSPCLSFNNLVEAHVLRFLRNKQELPMNLIRDSIDYAQSELGVDRLLLSKELRSDQQSIFLNKLSQLIDLSKSGQLAMKTMLESHLNRIDFRNDVLYGLYPFMPDNSESKVIFISPAIAFGRPVTKTNHISADVIADRVDTGEEIEEIAKDYRIDKEEIQQAILYARAA